MVSVAMAVIVTVFAGTAQARPEMGGAKAQSEGVFLQINGTRLTCEASDLGAFKLLCEVYEKITEEYIGSETTADMASKAARASGRPAWI